jgi:fermentation-respiration switch protein FrsA (DUF1100 family)
MPRETVEFSADGTVLRGWLFRPRDRARLAPVVVMAHGFSAVKEMHLPAYAEVFASAGFVVLVYDHRNFGASDGQPRQEIDPWQQVRDWRDAITWVGQQPGVDPSRIGIWGTSYAGGHALVLGAIDRRVRCVVAQVPLVSGHANARRLTRADMLAPVQAMFDADRLQRHQGQPPALIPVVSNAPGVPAALPTADSWQWFTETARTHAPAWRNEVTLRSIEMYTEYEPGTYIARIAPTPLLMVVAAGDHLAVADLALDAYNRACEPKRLELLPGGHFDAYAGAGFEQASAAARDWFVRHLHERTA